MTILTSIATTHPARTGSSYVLPCLGIGFLVILAAFGPVLAPHSATAFNASEMLASPSWVHPLGTDAYGRDVLSRILVGARPTIVIAFASAFIGVALGLITGLIAGFRGGAIDEIAMRAMDVLMSFPALMLAMLVVVVMGSDAATVVVALAIVIWPRSARIVRSVTQSVATTEFVAAASARGESLSYILFHEIVPNIRTVVIVDLSLRMTTGVLLAASLAYLGIGVQAPTPAWGLMVHEGQSFIQLAPRLVIIPCAAIAITAIILVIVGEQLRARVAIPIIKA